MTLSKNDQQWGVLNLLRRLLAAEWETPEQVRDSRATQWGTAPSKGHFSTKSSIPAFAWLRQSGLLSADSGSGLSRFTSSWLICSICYENLLSVLPDFSA